MVEDNKVDQQEEASKEEDTPEDTGDGLGEALPEVDHPRVSKEGNSAIIAQLVADPLMIQQYRDAAQALIGQFQSRREALENEVDVLAECVAIASEIYRSFPIPDNAYQLSSLVNAHNSSLSLLEKSKDPKVIMKDIEVLVKGMFNTVARSLTLEIDKTKKEFTQRFPDEKASVDIAFNRMFASVAPETQNLYDGLQDGLKKVLGIKDAKSRK